jgi:thioredoxin 2
MGSNTASSDWPTIDRPGQVRMSGGGIMAAGIIQCLNCGRRNRIPDAAAGAPRCRDCHKPLPWITAANDGTFAEVVERSRLPVLVDLWAPWCAPCKVVSPALERVARDLAGTLKLVKIDVDAAPRLSQRFKVRAVPTLMIVKNGQVVARRAGAAASGVLRRWVEDALGSAR